MKDADGRLIDYARISITDRCNLRCVYCMPKEGAAMLTHDDILTYEEIVTVARALAVLGIRYLKITGGEPMARIGCLSLINKLKSIPGIEEVSMTTNGILLDGHMQEAVDAGLDGLNISLDTLVPEQYARMTRLGEVEKVLSVLSQAVAAGIPSVKVNAVPIRGYNEDSLVGLARLAEHDPIHVRFIELMPVGCGGGFAPVSQEEIMKKLEAAFGPLSPERSVHGHGPALYVHPAGFKGSIGFISAVSHAFCAQCNRVRITADGQLKLCLNHAAGVPLKPLLRSGAGEAELKKVMREAIYQKPLRHGFGERLPDQEDRKMFQIGG